MWIAVVIFLFLVGILWSAQPSSQQRKLARFQQKLWEKIPLVSLQGRNTFKELLNRISHRKIVAYSIPLRYPFSTSFLRWLCFSQTGWSELELDQLKEAYGKNFVQSKVYSFSLMHFNIPYLICIECTNSQLNFFMDESILLSSLSDFSEDIENLLAILNEIQLHFIYRHLRSLGVII